MQSKGKEQEVRNKNIGDKDYMFRIHKPRSLLFYSLATKTSPLSHCQVIFQGQREIYLFNVFGRANTAKTPRALASIRMLLIMAVLAGMLPTSFGMFPQCGEVILSNKLV